MKKLLKILTGVTLSLAMAIGVGVGVANNNKKAEPAFADQSTYSLTPNQASTGSEATTYITTLTEFSYLGVSWKMNQWNPKTLQIKTNQSNATDEFRFYNTSAFSSRIRSVVIKFSALTVSDSSKLMFLGGTSEVSGTTGGTAGTWNSTNKTLTWTPGNSDNFTYFAFYQNGKAASGTNNLASSDAIVVTYGSGNSPTLSSIAISGSMTKTSYTTAEEWNPAGLTVTGTYDNDDTANLTASAAFSYYSNEAMTSVAANPSALGMGNKTLYIKATVSGVSNSTAKSQSVSVTPVTYTVTYNANGGTGEMIDSSSPYSASSTVTILNNSFSRDGYTFVCFNTQADGFGTDYNSDETFTITANTVLYAKWKYPYTDADNKITWDLSKTSYDSMGASAATWVSTKASISVEKATSSTATNNACPPNYEHTRFYQNSVMTISPVSGYKITSIVFTATSNDYATKIKNSTWTNATKTSNSTTATIVPEVKINPVSVTFSNAVYITQIVVNYAVYSALDHISLSGTYPTAFNQGNAFSHEGMVVTATYENGSTANVTSSAVWSGYNMSGSGSQTVTVTYTEELVEKTATYTITVTVAPFIEPEKASITGQVGGDPELLSFNYDNLTGDPIVVSNDTSIVEISDLTFDAGEGIVQLSFVGSGTTTVLFKDGEQQLASVSVTVTRTTSSASKQLLSANLTATATCTSGFTIIKNDKCTLDGDHHKDGGTADSEVNYFVVKRASALFSAEPASIKFTARLRGGTSRPTLNNNVEACFVDSEGTEIETTKRTVTTGVTATQTNYTINLPYSSSAYGVKLMHLKETSWNIFYYSFELSYDYGSSVKTITGTENKTGEITTSVSSVVMRFGAKISTENWTAFNSEHTITDYGVMFAKKATLDANSISSVKSAYETKQSLIFIVRKGSGTAPTPNGGKYVFTSYLSIDSSDYETIFCAAPFIVADGQYYFLDEMRYSVKTLATECQTTHGSPLSSEALAILAGNN